jgi:hypothetical protein
MSDVFKITKHIKEWEDNQNLYMRISGELTDEAINWYKNRTIAQIWESCILTWNKNHFKSCKSVTELETCFLERGIDNLKRELFGCLYITMSNLRYMVQVVKSKFSAYNFKKIRIPQFSETRFGSFVGLFSCFYVYKQ